MRAPVTFSASIDDSTQYATVYDAAGNPVATLRRRHSFDPKDAPRWQAWDLQGQSLRKWFLPVGDYGRLVRDVERALIAKAKTAAPTVADLQAKASACDKAWADELAATYGKQACNARYDERGTATPALAALHAAKREAQDVAHSAWRMALDADIMARRPEIGLLIRDGRRVFYVVDEYGLPIESDAPELLPMPAKVAA